MLYFKKFLQEKGNMVKGERKWLQKMENDELEGASLLSESTISASTTHTRRKNTHAMSYILPWSINIGLLFIIFYLIKNPVQISVDRSQVVYCKSEFITHKLLLDLQRTTN